ncbi:MAG TPA: ATP-binding protein [Caldilineaceae bacterium]|nr:ATP-binding protein [Caldilineaceae bacterium]
MKGLTTNPKDQQKFDAAPVLPAEELNWRYLQAELARIDQRVRAAVARWQQAGRDPNDAFRGLVIGDEEAESLLSLPFGGNWGDLVSNGDAHEPADGAVEYGRTGAHVQPAHVQPWVSVAERQGATLRLRHLAAAFGLDAFEVDAFLVCLLPALDLRYEQVYSYLQNDINRKRATVDLVLGLLVGAGGERLRWLAHFTPDAPLLRHGLLAYVHDGGQPPPSLLAQSLAVDRTVIHWLLGGYHPPAELGARVELVSPESREAPLILGPALAAKLDQIATLPQPLLLFSGPDRTTQDTAAGAFAARLSRPLLLADMGSLATLAGQGQATLREGLSLVLRDARLTGAVAYLYGWDACLQGESTPASLLEMILSHPAPLIVAGRAVWQPQGVLRTRPVATLAFGLPDYARRQVLWRHYLAAAGLDSATLDPVAPAAQFTLTAGQIRDAVAVACDRALGRQEPVTQEDLFAGARAASANRLAEMAHKIIPRYGWDDIILPDDQIRLLRELVATVRGRSRVLEEWGLGQKLASSAAVTVLFAGPPGTGKTMAAEVIAGDLGLDLYKIDLSNLVSKYIGETEKNLERVFTEAQSSNAILFFDEADAIFGKRSGVKDAHDRYANLEISYLLQRMETYDGVTILATNLRSNLDEAFLRRLQFAVDLPFPDEKHRLRIWQTLFPANVPRSDDVNLEEMARRFKIAGGNIRNILLNAAYLAAADGGVITMQHLLHGARRELQKMGRLVLDGALQVD